MCHVWLDPLCTRLITVSPSPLAFLLLKALLGILVALNSKATHPDIWIREAFQVKLWGKPAAQTFYDFLCRRLPDPEQGQLKLFNLVIQARNQQFRTFPIKTIHYDEYRQQLGLIDRLLIDGQSMNWQICEKDPKGKTVRNSAFTDCYFANGKPIRLTETGLLTVILEQDDTANFLERKITIRIQLDLAGGVTDIASLLRTRCALVNPLGKQSHAKFPADVSIKEVSKSTTLPGMALTNRKERLVNHEGTSKTNIAKSWTVTSPAACTQVSHVDRTKGRISKVSKPETDLNQTTVATLSRNGDSYEQGQAGSSNAHEDRDKASITEPPESSDSQQERDDRLSSKTTNFQQHPEDGQVNHSIDETVAAGTNDLPPSTHGATHGRTPRTYAKSKVAKKSRNQESNANDGKGEHQDMISELSVAGKKRKVAEESDDQQATETKKPRTGRFQKEC